MAMEHFTLPGEEATPSRTPVITGTSRKEVPRVNRLPAWSDREVVERCIRAARMMSSG